MKRNWKFYLGIALIVFNLLSYAAIALLPFLGLTGGTVASLTAGLIIAAEIAFLGAIALLGKEFLEKIKAKVKGWFARPAAPPKPVSLSRHRAGVIVLLLSFLPYFAAEALLLLGHPRVHPTAWIIALLISSDILFVAGLFVLGGEFWERLKKLFEWPGDRDATRTSS
jgi:hypothetical protein